MILNSHLTRPGCSPPCTEDFPQDFDSEAGEPYEGRVIMERTIAELVGSAYSFYFRVLQIKLNSW